VEAVLRDMKYSANWAGTGGFCGGAVGEDLVIVLILLVPNAKFGVGNGRGQSRSETGSSAMTTTEAGWSPQKGSVMHAKT
jgi:hypothetical protein